MNFKCFIGRHTWSGCKCSVCGTTRDEDHQWDGCKCKSCGKTRDEGHQWEIGGCCKSCNKTREYSLNEVRDILQERLGYLTTSEFILALTMAGVANPERDLPKNVYQTSFERIENSWKKIKGQTEKPREPVAAPAPAPSSPTPVEKAPVIENKKQLSEEEKKSIYSEFHRFLNTHAMIEAASRGLRDREGLVYALEKSAEHIERSYSMSFDQWMVIFQEGKSKNWDKWP